VTMSNSVKANLLTTLSVCLVARWVHQKARLCKLKVNSL